MPTIHSPSYRSLLLQSQSERNRFSFRRDYVTSKVLTKIEALFIQDVINRITMKKARRVRLADEDGRTRIYTLCTRRFLARSLAWDRQSQIDLFSSLCLKGFCRIKRVGKNGQRHVWVDIVRLEKAVYETRANPKKGPAKRAKSLNSKPRHPNPVNSKPRHPNPVNSKPRHPVNSKPPSSNNEESNNEEYPSDTLCCLRNEGRSSLFFTANGKPLTPAKLLSNQLLEILVKYRKLMTKRGVREWPTYFTELLQSVSFKEVKATLAWFDENITCRYTPKKYCARTWCEQYPKIRESMIRQKDDERSSSGDWNYAPCDA